MEKQDEPFKFEFSLEILNLLGKGLYRSFATVIAEAISNSWDAEATEVYITIEKDKLTVEDNGRGMNSEDFQSKFLRIGYSRREDKNNKSKRNVIGRKGIGKLAMLSISERVTIFSKKKDFEITGGKINNPELDKNIKKDESYSLGSLTTEDIKNEFGGKLEHGTKIIFEKFKTRLNNENIIRKYLATQFNFVFNLNKNDNFKIIVNGKEIGEDDLEKLNDNTQFLWFLGEEDKNVKNRFINLVPSGKKIICGKIISDAEFYFSKEKIKIRGYIASVKTSSNLILSGSGGDFRAGVNLFTNGRLRQKDLIEDITTKGLAEEYLYGEIHVDGFEDEKVDRFTSSREGIIKDDLLYQEFIKKLKIIIAIIIKDWTPWRVELRQDGDLKNDKRPEYVVRLEQSKNRRQKDFEKKIEETIDDEFIKKKLKEKIRELSEKNTLIYQDLFTLENILREYIKIKKIKIKDLEEFKNSKDIEHCIKKLEKTKKDRAEDEERHALKGKIVENEHYLNYVDFVYLGLLIDIAIDKKHEKLKRYQLNLESDVKEIVPIRNAVMHTNEITDNVSEWRKIDYLINYIDKLSDKK